jgi:hypothetical protein
MAIPDSSNRGDVVLTSAGPKLDDAIAGLLNAIIAESLPAMANDRDAGESLSGRSTSVSAQAADTVAALTDLIESLLEAVDLHQGAIRGFELDGVMTGPDRCTIWGQARLAEASGVHAVSLTGLTLINEPGAVKIEATLRVERQARSC